MKVEEHLDFDDVYIKQNNPSNHTNNQYARVFKFKHSGQTLASSPFIFSQNVVTAEMVSRISQVTSMIHYKDAEDANNRLSRCWLCFDSIPRNNQKILDTPGVRVWVDVEMNDVQTIKHLRDTYSDLTILAGPVCDKAQASTLIDAGVDVIHLADSRHLSEIGVGFSKMATIMEIAEAVHKKGCFLAVSSCDDNLDHVTKAMACGADFIVLDEYLRGHLGLANEVSAKGLTLNLNTTKEEKNDLFKFSIDNAVEFTDEMPISEAFYTSLDSLSVEVTYDDGSIHKYKGDIENTLYELGWALISLMKAIGAKEFSEIPDKAIIVKK